MNLARLFRLVGLVLLIGIAAFLYTQRGAALAGSGWVAKRVCSGVFVAGRAEDALTEASLPLPLPIPIPATVDRDAKTVTAYFARFLMPSTARYRAGLGCTLDAGDDTPSPLDGRTLPAGSPGRALPERGIVMSSDATMPQVSNCRLCMRFVQRTISCSFCDSPYRARRTSPNARCCTTRNP